MAFCWLPLGRVSWLSFAGLSLVIERGQSGLAFSVEGLAFRGLGFRVRL